MSVVLIDARFLLRYTTETFWGVNLNVGVGKDNIFCFGFLRDLLRLRNSLRVSAGAVVFGSDAFSVAAESEVRSVANLCRELGVLVIEEPTLPALAIVAAHVDRFSDLVTDDLRILRFCSEKLAIHLVKDARSIERMTPDGVQRNLGVPVRHVPTYLALTEGCNLGRASNKNSQPTVTTREARRLIELYGSLPDIYRHLSTVSSPILRKKLADNQKTFDHRYRDNMFCPFKEQTGLQGSLEWRLDGKKNEAILRERCFYSLIRMIALPDPPVGPLTTNDRIRPRRSYQAVLNSLEFDDMLVRIARSKVCAIDTEADDKDPRTATLFGISLAAGRGAAFFVPFCERDMGNLTQDMVRSGLRKLFKEWITFVGHNLKYDFMLLHRNGIGPPIACFDTLLAAHDCYGDLDFFSLPFLAQRLLGQKIKSYAEIVPKRRTFLEFPFEEMMEHACVDADVALQLHRLLERELKGRGIDRQFEERTMPLALALLNLEKDGIPVDGERLEYLRGQFANNMVDLKRRICEGTGSEIDLDSQEEIAGLIGEKHGFREVLGRKWLTQPVLEQLACVRPLLKLVVEYKRTGRRLKRVQSIIRSNRQGRVYPLLSQTRMRDGRISSSDPDLFADDGLGQLRGCIGGESAAWIPDRRRSLDLAQRVSGDLVLKNDRTGPGSSNLFMACQPSMNGLDHDDLLFRVLIGESSHRLSTRFLVDRLTVSNIVHALETRYPMVFRYLAEAKAQGLKRGYVEQGGMRRYFDGLRSSSIEKRNAAQQLACQWLLQF